MSTSRRSQGSQMSFEVKFYKQWRNPHGLILIPSAWSIESSNNMTGLDQSRNGKFWKAHLRSYMCPSWTKRISMFSGQPTHWESKVKQTSSVHMHRSSPCFCLFLSIFILYLYMSLTCVAFFFWCSSVGQTSGVEKVNLLVENCKHSSFDISSLYCC